MQKYDEFEFTKLISKERDKIKFLNLVFRTKLFNSGIQTECSDIFITIPIAKGLLHLSIVVVLFDSENKNNEIFNFYSG